MSGSFLAQNVPRDAVPQALPLLRATWPEMDLPKWQSFAEAFCDDRSMLSAITGLFDPSGGLCGLFASRVERDLCEGRLLAIPLFTVVDIGNSLSPVQAMVDAASEKARESACLGFEIRLAAEQGGLLKRLRHLGLQPRVSLLAPVAPGQPIGKRAH